MPKKKGPPYTDDPGCKYIVIDDPWPGNASGKARNQVFFNHLCTWVRFMLGKAVEPEAVYHLNTRDEVIVQLPKQTDITPVLGAHAWRKFLSRGEAKDKDRVSYVFEYDYRNRGEPGNHNWLEIFPTVSGDPPPHIRFPVIFPYPHVSWASPKGKRCADLALPLPPTRQPTPIPDTSLFEPYQHPSQLTSSTVERAQERPADDAPSGQQHDGQPATTKLGKMDPYEQETNALRALRADLNDKSSVVKREPGEVRVKPDPESGSTGVKQEPDVYGPSKAFRSTVERLQQARAHLEQATHNKPEDVKPALVDDMPAPPSAAFVEAFNRVRRPQSGPVPEHIPIKEDLSETISTPSESFVAAFQRARHGQPANALESHVRVKPDPADGRHNDLPGRSSQREPSSNPKRLKQEEPRDTNERKRFKSEMY
ncbi:hypothetical protein PYCCODRAFT_1439044 [Trametes coccinea BRFM310]|uniref:Uncharacterized protein n=1 Tax=Trametes coccinea (strain BRFM310) TaxID=1353009 RepID=A0A1Y2ICB0_TRAC3|nr:hypothetical protein PYCCODRAFT_1439044 [Trametes coccinea BRFM310]